VCGRSPDVLCHAFPITSSRCIPTSMAARYRGGLATGALRHGVPIAEVDHARLPGQRWRPIGPVTPRSTRQPRPTWWSWPWGIGPGCSVAGHPEKAVTRGGSQPAGSPAGAGRGHPASRSANILVVVSGRLVRARPVPRAVGRDPKPSFLARRVAGHWPG
jgi:hypothetical protein